MRPFDKLRVLRLPPPPQIPRRYGSLGMISGAWYARVPHPVGEGRPAGATAMSSRRYPGATTRSRTTPGLRSSLPIAVTPTASLRVTPYEPGIRIPALI